MLQSACWNIFIHEQTQHIPINFAFKPVITRGGNAIIISWQELWDRYIWENIKTWLNIMDIAQVGGRAGTQRTVDLTGTHHKMFFQIIENQEKQGKES